MSDTDLMTTEEVAAYLKLTPATVKRKAAAGELPGIKPGREWLFHRDDLLNHLRNQSPCFTNAKTHATSGAGSMSAARKLDDLLKPPTKETRKRSRSSSGTTSGDSV